MNSRYGDSTRSLRAVSSPAIPGQPVAPPAKSDDVAVLTPLRKRAAWCAAAEDRAEQGRLFGQIIRIEPERFPFSRSPGHDRQPGRSFGDLTCSRSLHPRMPTRRVGFPKGAHQDHQCVLAAKPSRHVREPVRALNPRRRSEPAPSPDEAIGTRKPLLHASILSSPGRANLPATTRPPLIL